MNTSTWTSSSVTSPGHPTVLTDSRVPLTRDPAIRVRRAIDLIGVRWLLEDSRQSTHAVRWLVGRTVQVDVETLADRVSVLLSEGRVRAARNLAALVGGDWSELLAAPVVQRGPKAGDGETRFRSNRAWLKKNRHNPAYKGMWVALQDGGLVGADESRVTLHRALEQEGNLDGALVVRLT